MLFRKMQLFWTHINRELFRPAWYLILMTMILQLFSAFLAFCVIGSLEVEHVKYPWGLSLRIPECIEENAINWIHKSILTQLSNSYHYFYHQFVQLKNDWVQSGSNIVQPGFQTRFIFGFGNWKKLFPSVVAIPSLTVRHAVTNFRLCSNWIYS